MKLAAGGEATSIGELFRQAGEMLESGERGGLLPLLSELERALQNPRFAEGGGQGEGEGEGGGGSGGEGGSGGGPAGGAAPLRRAGAHSR